MNYTIKIPNFTQRGFSKSLLSLVIFAGLGCSPKLIILQQKPEWAKGGYNYYVGRIEHKLSKSKNDPVLFQQGCQALTQYTFGFIMEEADRIIMTDYLGGKKIFMEANLHFGRAVNYGNKSLSLKFDQYDNWISNQSDQIPNFTEADISYLFWTAAAYGGAIKSSRGNPEWVVLLPRVGQLLEVGLNIDPDWNKGALYSAMISYTMSRHDPPKQVERVAEDYFNKAVAASNGLDIGTYVNMAESVSIPTQNKNQFTNLLYKALNIDIKENTDLVLTNQINRNRAQWLLDNIDEYFY